jgi:hypothetical protein
MNDDDVKRLVEDAEQQFEMIFQRGLEFLREDGYVHPLYVFWPSRGHPIQFGIPLECEDDVRKRDEVVKLLRVIHDARMIVMFGMAWFVPVGVASPRVSDRREALAAQMAIRLGDGTIVVKNRMREVLRAADGGVSGFGLEHDTLPGQCHLADALAGPLPHRAAQRAAKRMLRKLTRQYQVGEGQCEVIVSSEH